MKPVFATKRMSLGERGNCLAACLASVFEVDLAAVPQLEELPPGAWKGALAEWAAGQGAILVRSPAARSIEGYGIAVGITQTGVRHAMVCQGDALVHDPNPNCVPFREIEYFLHFDPMPADDMDLCNHAEWACSEAA